MDGVDAYSAQRGVLTYIYIYIIIYVAGESALIHGTAIEYDKPASQSA